MWRACALIHTHTNKYTLSLSLTHSFILTICMKKEIIIFGKISAIVGSVKIRVLKLYSLHGNSSVGKGSNCKMLYV